jgi:hypothetical protein
MKLPLDQAELERPRKPSELSSFVNELFQTIKGNEEAKQKARLGRDHFKEFIREILPLSIYVSWRYPDDQVRCAPRIGNQGYDAEITSLDNEHVEWIEVTWPEDGQLRKLVARLLNEHGHVRCCVDPMEGRAEMTARFLRKANDKSLIDYGNASLLFVLDLLPNYYFKQPGTKQDLDQLVKLLRSMNWTRVDRVFLIPLPRSYVEDNAHVIPPVIPIKKH